MELKNLVLNFDYYFRFSEVRYYSERAKNKFTRGNTQMKQGVNEKCLRELMKSKLRIKG